MATKVVAAPVLDPVACCAPVRSSRFDDEQAEVIASAFAALADPIRLRLLAHVAAAGEDEVCACDLGAIVDRSQPTISHHLKVLHAAGLLDRSKRGVWVYYKVNAEAMAGLAALIGGTAR